MDINLIISECRFKAVRSSGAGGQHVNKVSSKVELSFNIEVSKGLTDEEKSILKQRLKLSKEGNLILQSSESRSQHRNKDIIVKKLIALLKQKLVTAKKRKATKPKKSAVLKRLKKKNIRKEVKKYRRKPELD